MTMKLFAKHLAGGTSKKKDVTKPEKQDSITSIDDSTRETEGESWYENGFFHDELSFIRSRPEVTKVTFKDFVERHERDDLLALGDAIKSCDRTWKAIKFSDTVLGTNYRRWRFKKDSVKRSIGLALDEVGMLHRVHVLFETTLKIDMDEIPCPAIVDILAEAEKDDHISTISLEGFVESSDIEAIVDSLIKVIGNGKRRFKSIAMRCSFDGDDFEEWDRQVSLARSRLDEVKITRELPIEFCVC